MKRVEHVTIYKDQSPRFRGELMVCAICGVVEKSSDDKLSMWTWYSTSDLAPWGLYYCPAEPVALSATDFLKAAEKERKRRMEKYQQ